MASSDVANFAEIAAACRLDTQRSQHIFRSMMESASRPGRLEYLEVPSEAPTAVFPTLALCDLETSVAVLGSSSGRNDWEAFVVAMTGARRAPVSEAGWVVVLDPTLAPVALAAPVGSAEAPELGARLIVMTDRLHATPELGPELSVELVGPGIDGVEYLWLDGVPASFFGGLDDANRRFPAGLDVWFVDPAGRLAALPRSVRSRVLAEETN